MTALDLEVGHMPRRKRGRPRKVKLNDEGLAKIKRMLLPEEGSDVPTKSKSYKRKRAVIEDFYVNAEVMNAVMSKAEEIKANLSQDHPTLMKIMLPSHVSNGFWLGLSREFCDDHMSIVDRKVELEDESGSVWSAKYLAVKQGLSGGWRAFAIAHELVKGDVAIFQLLKQTKFKVYIVRSNASKEAGVDSGTPSLDSTEPGTKCCQEEKGDQDSVSQQPSGSEAEPNRDTRSSMLCDNEDDDDDGSAEDGSSSNGFVNETSEGTTTTKFLQRPPIDFKQVKDFDYFGIIANGSIINHELPKQVGFKYYELCCSQDSFLHQHLLEGLNSKLVAGIICETVHIADAIRAFEYGATGNEELESWGSRLEAFEKLGMNVAFLLTRLRQLMCLSDKANKYKRLRTERSDVEERVKVLEAQLGEAKGKMEELDVEIEGLGIDGFEVALRELANAPWS